jgi:hypothetical protein
VEKEMMKSVICAAIAAATMLATPALAEEATQEPGIMAFNYPDSHYLTGGHGVRATPWPGYYYRHRYVGPGTALPFGPAYATIYGEPDLY